MLTATGAVELIRQAAADAPAAPSSSPGWWEVLSGVLLAVAGMWATWAQFVYPKIAERRARRGDPPPPPVVDTAPANPTDLVGVVFRDQAQRLDGLLDDLEGAHRQARRDAGTIARLTAELAECRRQPCRLPHQQQGAPP